MDAHVDASSARVNYLWQLANHHHGTLPLLSHYYSREMVDYASEHGVPLPPSAGHSICRYCSCLLVSGRGCRARLRGRTKRSPGAARSVRRARAQRHETSGATWAPSTGRLAANELVLTCETCSRTTAVKGITRRQRHSRRQAASSSGVGRGASKIPVERARQLGSEAARSAKRSYERPEASEGIAQSQRRTVLGIAKKKKKKNVGGAAISGGDGASSGGSLAAFLGSLPLT